MNEKASFSEQMHIVEELRSIKYRNKKKKRKKSWKLQSVQEIRKSSVTNHVSESVAPARCASHVCIS